jgi:hypothetical protein
LIAWFTFGNEPLDEALGRGRLKSVEHAQYQWWGRAKAIIQGWKELGRRNNPPKPKNYHHMVSRGFVDVNGTRAPPLSITSRRIEFQDASSFVV